MATRLLTCEISVVQEGADPRRLDQCRIGLPSYGVCTSPPESMRVKELPQAGGSFCRPILLARWFLYAPLRPGSWAGCFV